MARTDPIAQPGDIAVALALLTRLPVSADHARGAHASWAWPLAGLAVGLGAAVVGGLGLWLGLPAALTAVAILLTQVMLTGGLHEDGLADIADGFWGGHEKARRLEIMKDSRVGSYGVIALCLSLLARWAALTALLSVGGIAWALIAVGLLSRAPMPVLMAAMPNARGQGLSAQVGQPGQPTATLAVIIAILGAFFCLGAGALAPILWATLATIALAGIAKAKIGGQTGDVLGASQQLAEIAALAALTATLA
ncbi:adenosylcobinamide-GDP ribazoletransferase [Maritimibacter sp. DP07]|uniref:Adenosylcobinamide-GDP ribazoletransferase n=1 Tax=Maritimibacter harenae TaxID=2606218 RepID=A0A845M3B7_9RHOB|nr:adenosylcobinamide-GDP ribazoletransferase [Maritimibacter harenae]MZR14056.1 adenosylcobinamide-GDP ribazoletransferase [Maritimibacter harenae]